jgi:hypothetical protein
MTAQTLSAAFASATGGGDPVVTKPAGTVDGNLLIAFGDATAGHTITQPAGMPAPRAESLGINAPLWIWTANSEPATYEFAVTGGLGNASVTIIRVDDHDPSDPIDDIKGHASTTTLVIPTATSAGTDRLLLQGVLKNQNTTFTAPGTVSIRWNGLTAGNNFRAVGGDEIVGAGPTGTRTWTPTSGTAPGVGYAIVIAPAVAPNAGTFAGGYNFTGTFTGEAGPSEGTFGGGYDYTGTFTGEAPGISSGTFAGGYDFTGSFTGSAPPPTPPSGEGRFTPGGRDRFTGRRTPKNRRRSQ